MKIRKLVVSIILIVIMALIMQVPSYAAVATNPMYIGITEMMTEDNPDMGYAIGDPNSNGVTPTAAKIWNLMKYTSLTSSDPTEADIYCVKAGVGFDDVHRLAEYNIFYNMKTEREAIRTQNDTLRSLVEGTKDGVSVYDAMLALFDIIYLVDYSTQEDFDNLLAAAGIDSANFAGFEMTFDDVLAVQQAVIWHFTNYDWTQNSMYDQSAKTDWLWYTLDNGTNYQNLADYNPTSTIPSESQGAARTLQADILYDYLVAEAISKAPEYSNVTTDGVPAQLNTTTLNYELVSGNYILGPINITENANPVPYTIDFSVKNNNTAISNYTLLDSNKAQVAAGTSVEDLVGTDFYVSIPEASVESISIDMSINYTTTQVTLWASSTNNLEQPVVIPTREVESVPYTLAITPEKNEFDLSLIKRIVQVNNQNVPERLHGIDVSDLNVIGANGQMGTEVVYDMDKTPVMVKQGDIVTYTLRIYNQGTMDGYASEISEDIPEGLEFIWSAKTGADLDADTTLTSEEKEAVEFNQDYLWQIAQIDSNGKTTLITTDYLSKDNETTVEGNLIPAFGDNDGTKTEADLHYKEVSVKMKVVAENISGEVIRNEAAITEDTDEDGNEVDDRDSDTEDWVKYEDDEDFDNIILQSFDIALRKFITAISQDVTIDPEDELVDENGSYTRAPVVDTTNLNKVDANGNMITTAEYNHPKDPILVQPNDYIVYTLRVYNEGDIDGYAAEIKDFLPPHLEYVDGEFNDNYGWTIDSDGRTVTTRYLEDTLLEKPTTGQNGNLVLSYEEVQIMCKIKEDAPTNENITNLAEITEYQDENKDSVIDRDSEEDNIILPTDEELPGYKEDETGEYIPGQEDDDDFEKVIIKIFDLALRKWVTEAILIENGETTVIQTGHQPFDDPEPIVKVELDRKNLDEIVLKFRYSIRVYNQGDIEGYVKEITDYIPEGLKFLPEDNPGWVDEGNNVISTKLTENILLKPGEYTDVEVLLTWINDGENTGVMINTAEISEDYNEEDIPDIDSIPDNEKEGEDDIDTAPVLPSISTGQERIYYTLGFTILISIVVGIVLIKRYVL